MNDAQRQALAAVAGSPAASLTIEPVALTGAPGCNLVRVQTGQTGPAGTLYALQDGDDWLTFRDEDALARAFAACGDAPPATLALLVTALSREAGAYAVLTEPKPGFVIRALGAAGWTFQPPTVQSTGAGRQLDFFALGPDGAGVVRVEATWAPNGRPSIEVTPAPQ